MWYIEGRRSWEAKKVVDLIMVVHHAMGKPKNVDVELRFVVVHRLPENMFHQNTEKTVFAEFSCQNNTGNLLFTCM